MRRTQSSISRNSNHGNKMQHILHLAIPADHNRLRWLFALKSALMPLPRLPADDDEMPQELLDLGRQLTALSGPRQSELLHSYQRVVDSIRRRRRILSLVQEALSQLRLDIKYLMFDLEATRAERDELREQLNDER